ncbi:AbrB/MazE/SpoVT family DNA-binding domain-containing protein [Pediococcus parvulus]|uniref:AbrB/MazE/SpoVT family DNA-binding domain-containing protein n=1 Tax=Pediococcus parvulus TaxID=54062 RepID=UPI0021A57752|nr:AbrB/MazE/SpoVT family DNA-binding domain-containing protein [Pediococcus parvulus]MCT3035361.1 AbrB/MazE/SpoVT family DNA-binding domain-containing protein [Pediococcus parvulus]
MDNILSKSAKLSSRGQVVIPVEIRNKMQLSTGDEIAFTQTNDGDITITKLPTRLEWEDLIKNIPTEVVDIDENGHYDPKKSPDFDKWMKEDDSDL